MHPGNRYSSLTRIALQNMLENKTNITHILTVVLGHFMKASCAKHLLVTKTHFLRKRTFGPWNFQHL